MKNYQVHVVKQYISMLGQIIDKIANFDNTTGQNDFFLSNCHAHEVVHCIAAIPPVNG